MGLDLNYIEGQTPLDDDEKEGLRVKTITTRSELDELEQLNIEQAIEWSLSNSFSKEKILSEQFIKLLHKKMFGDVWDWAGKFRKSNKNIGVEWIFIGTELKKLNDDALFWINNNTYPADEFAIRYKHKLVNIHCFPNGNGRHSRIMADIIIESIFEKEIFSWNVSSLVKANESRTTYIKAIREADKGNIQPLITFARSIN